MITPNRRYLGQPPEELSFDDPVLMLAGAIDQCFQFSPLPKQPPPAALVLVGLPGAGKTVTTAKIATQAVMERRRIHVVSADTVRAGGFAQLEAFTKILELDLMSAGDPATLAEAVGSAPPGALSVIDCAGGNPFNADDHERQIKLLRGIDAEIAFVMAAGGDPAEAADLAEIYRAMGAKRLIVTRVDATRRLGAMLSAAASGDLAISDIGVSSSVSDGLRAVNPISLARLLLPQYVAAGNEDERAMYDEGPARAYSA